MPKIDIRETKQGAVFSVKAKPGSRNNEIRAARDGCLVIAVTAVAEKGRANEAIIQLLAKHLGIAKNRLTIVAGAASSTKSVNVDAMSACQLLNHFAGR